jgi:glucose-6-phosphate 1-epimerase
MDVPDVDGLNMLFGGPGKPQFVTSPGGLVLAQLEHQGATAVVALQGGHVLRYVPAGARPVLWLSRMAYDAPGKAIRGGVPVCWPWFGPHPDNPALPQHGFVRTALWRVLETGVGSLRLGLHENAQTMQLWPYRWSLDLLVTLGDGLEIALTMRNTGDTEWSCTGALHSYFAVSDASTISISGLEQCVYHDKVTGAEAVQPGLVTISGEVDRVYRDTTATCVIDDPGWQRQIVIQKAGSRSTVVWNPWQEKAARMADFGDDEYMAMVCVETANAGDDIVRLAPGEGHRTRVRYRLSE